MQPSTQSTLTAAEVLGRTMSAFQNGDVTSASLLMHPDITWHSPGKAQPAAGTHRGRDRVLEAFGTIATQSGELTLEVLDVLGGSRHGGLLYNHRREREHHSLNARICLIATVSDGQLTEVWEHIYDIHAFDDFYGRA
jgi:ketosteroid isomerase-like protein